MTEVKQSLTGSEYRPPEWQSRHEAVYTRLVSEALAGGVDEDEKSWLEHLASALDIRNPDVIHSEVLRGLFWQLMADGQVSTEEEHLAKELIRTFGLSSASLSEELALMEELIRTQEVRESGPPIIQPEVKLQKGEVCHHITKGAFLEKKILRSLTRSGQKYKEEGLVISKQGDIYITSKRILMVSDGTTSIPHQKVLDIEVHQDEKLIEIVKDGRQKPLYIRVPDAVYSGALIGLLSEPGS